MKSRKVICFICILVLISSLASACQPKAVQTDGSPKQTNTKQVDEIRKQTLYVTGLCWGGEVGFNVMSGNSNFPCNNTNNELIYETLFGYNGTTGNIDPILAEAYQWVDDNTIKVVLRKGAYFSDGKPLTSADVVYSYHLGKKYEIPWSSLWLSTEDIVAEGDNTIIFKLSKTNYNWHSAIEELTSVPIYPKHIWEQVEKDANYETGKMYEFTNDSPVGSGPYMVKSIDETKIVLERDDNYWGKALYGKLPAPKYITHLLFKSNDSANLALKNGDLDYSQDFIPNVWKMWEAGAAVRTYIDKLPYYVPDSIPSLVFNLSKKGLDNLEVRKALAYAIDYKNIVDIAMNGYSDVVEPALTVNIPNESKYIDKEAIKQYQWHTDIDKANEILDAIGAKKGQDGIRVLPDGTRLGPWDLECPYGWTDWNATLEIVMQNAKKAGIELRTKFPEEPVYYNDRDTGSFDIVMTTPGDVISPAQPWLRARDVMYSRNLVPIGEVTFRNFGRYKNPKANDILDVIAKTKDEAQLKKLYTELTILYLQDIPTIPLMYRPTYFFTVNEAVWKGFPKENDGTDIPPYCFDGAGIKSLYNLSNEK